MLLFLVIFILICVLLLFFSIRRRKNLKDKGFAPDSMVANLKYVCGHPLLDNPVPVNIAVKEGVIYILSAFSKELGTIKDVKQILVEDATTIQRRPTLVRFLALGIFAFALPKKRKDHLAYLIIEWNDGKFDHETVFEYEGSNALSRANRDRNKIIRQLS